jgi:hypothetical protein
MEDHMSRKTKRHKNQGSSDAETNVQKGTESTLSNLSGQAQSALNSVRQTAGNNKVLVGLIGVGAGIAGAAAFLLKTERGQAISEQVGETITDSMGRIRDLSMSGLTRIRDFVTESEIDTDELSESESETPYSTERLRRVV